MVTAEPIVIIALAITAFLAGTVDAIAGGGGLITLPALLMAGLPTHMALGTNKGQSMWGSLAAMIAFARAGKVDRKQAAFAFPLGLVGSFTGAQLVMLVDREVLKPVVIAMLIGAAVLLVVRKPSRDDRDLAPERRRRYLVMAGILAFVIGAYDGFFGPGTGTFLIVGFVALCGHSLTGATADAKVVNFASNLAAVAVFSMEQSIAWQIAIPMAFGQLAGGIIGARLALKGGAQLIRLVVLIVSGALVVKLLADLV